MFPKNVVGSEMKHLFYEEWKNKRVKKIESIFGRDWFCGKSILELGAAHGDVGLHFLKLGAEVIFTDIREEYLQSIKNKVKDLHYTAYTLRIDQNERYDLGHKFDLVIHMAVLYCLENWRQDLECAMKHTDCMILDTAFNKGGTAFTQEDVEGHLKDLGCKFIRLDTSDLNTDWSWLTNGQMIKHKYDWTHESLEYQKPNSNFLNSQLPPKHDVWLRRFWIVLK